MRTKPPLVDRKILVERQQDCGNDAVRQVIRVTWHDHLLIAGLIAAAKETAVCTFIGQIIPSRLTVSMSAGAQFSSSAGPIRIGGAARLTAPTHSWVPASESTMIGAAMAPTPSSLSSWLIAKPSRAVRCRSARMASIITFERGVNELSLIHISEPTRLGMISYAVFCLK